MAECAVVDQELIVHIFAPLVGPEAAMAEAQVRGIWSRCHDLLSTTDPIAWTGLRTTLPTDLHADMSVEQALAGLQGRTEDCQVIVRQLADVLSMSIIFAAPNDSFVRGRRIGSAAPAGWIEFDRWWGELAADGTDKFLGVVRVCQAKHTGDSPSVSALASAVRAEVPQSRAEPDWWDYGESRPEGFTTWELCPPKDTRADRQIVVLAPVDRDPQLCAWTWSQGDVTIPPLARYLLHAAKVRHQARRWHGERSFIDRLRDEADDRVQRLRDDLNQPVVLDQLVHDEVNLVVASTSLQETRLSATINSANMTAALTKPLPGDRGLIDWFVRELGGTADYLDLALERVRQIRGIAPTPPRKLPSPLTSITLAPHDYRQELRNGPSTESATSDWSESLVSRIGFALDIVRYRERSAPDRDYLQQRLAVLVDDVLDDLGARLADTDHQGTGAGVIIYLPTEMRPHESLPCLLQSLRVRLERSNRRFVDRMRLRLAVGSGISGVAALSLAGGTVNDVRRLLNSTVLRRAMVAYPEADLAALISDQLYSLGIRRDRPSRDVDFPCEQVHIKPLSVDAWLWVGRE